MSASQRSVAEREATLPRYVLAVTNKNRKRERDRKRRQKAEETIEGGQGRRKRSRATVVDDSEDNVGEVEKGVEGDADPPLAEEDDISALERAMSPSSPRGAAMTPSSSTPPVESARSAPVTTISAPAAVEEIGTGVTRSDRAEAEAMLKLGLGKASRASPAATDKILNGAFAVAGPEAMEEMLGLCRKWRDGLIYETKGDIERKTAALWGEWGGRVPEGEQKDAIVAVHVSAYWALCDDADDFVRGIVRRGRLADFWEAFQALLRPVIKPNLGWKKKFGEVKKARLKEAHPDLDPRGEEYRRQARRFEHQLQ